MKREGFKMMYFKYSRHRKYSGLKNFPFIFNRSSLILLSLSSLILMFLFSCSSPTEGKTVTFSGTVTLADTTDFSGVTVSLYKPVEPDTALTNLNARYPGVGIAINQRTEFFWREHQPAYTTTTEANGSWKIKNVTQGEYHIVAQAPGYGWRVSYNAEAGAHDISLTKAIRWNGTYSSDVTVPPNSFVQITGNTTFESSANLTIDPGTVMEFQNDATLETHGTVRINGVLGNEVFIVPEDTSNNSRMRLIESDNSVLDYICCMYLKNGIYINTVDSIQINHSRFSNQQYAFELFNCGKAHVENNVISDMTDGLASQETNLTFLKNIIYNINENGIKSANENGTLIEKNVIKKCHSYGIGFNISGSPASYPIKLNYKIYYNDFEQNANHIFVGVNGNCIANNNNFLKTDEFLVETQGVSSIDSLDFTRNYWGYINDYEISLKVLDRNDRINEDDKGPIVDFSNFRTEKIKWN